MANIARFEALLQTIPIHPKLELLESGAGSEATIARRMKSDAMCHRPLNRLIAMLAPNGREAGYQLLPEVLAFVFQPSEVGGVALALPSALFVHGLYCGRDPFGSMGQTGSFPLDSGAARMRRSIGKARFLTRELCPNKWILFPVQAQAAI